MVVEEKLLEAQEAQMRKKLRSSEPKSCRKGEDDDYMAEPRSSEPEK